MICAFCETKATQKCTVCDEVFCKECGEAHIRYFNQDKLQAKKVTQMEPLDAKII